VDASIGRALVAGVIPGILLTLLLMLMIQALGFFKPGAMPRQKIDVTWKERLSSLGQIAPVIFIVLLVIGGMYIGAFPPTVGGAIGSVGVLMVAAIKRMSPKVIAHSFYETVLINAQLFPLIIAGFLFSRFIALSGLSESLLGLITQANFHPIALMLVIIIFYLFIGCVLEFMSMAIITLPIVYPLLTGVGFDPMATIIILVLLSEIALITPPIGLSAFLIAGVAKVPPETVFKGILPFFFTSLILLWLLVLFPAISTWLPNFFYGVSP
jgi:tripartite ATP-independent transporter DctM subunit